MDAPTEAVVAVVGNDMGVVAIVDNVAHLHAVKTGILVPLEVVVVLLLPQEVSFLVVGIMDGTSHFCKSKGIYCVDSAMDGGGS